MISVTFIIISVLVSMNTVVNGNNDNDNNLVAVKPKHHCQQQQRKLEAPIHMNINDDNLPNPMMTTNSNNVDNHSNNDVYYCQSEDGKKYNIKYPNVMNTIPFVTEVNNSRYFNQYTELSDFLEGVTALSYYYHQQHQSNSSLTEAICEFRPLKYSRHFPHIMQQLYRCWSWWESNPTLPPLLVWKDYQIFLHQYNVQYVITFLTVLQQSYNLTIVDPLLNTTPNRILNRKNMVRSKNTGLFSNDIDITDYAMLSSYHAYSLQQLFYNYIQSTANLTTRPAIQSGGCRTDRSEPNISILNRQTQSKRSILNSQVIAAQIQQLYPNSIVRVEYFENTTMLQQVQFFMESDIILSPHGAQLTGILYQPITASSSSRTSSCSQILELIPQDYLVADFFGSLAKVAGIQHSFFYVQPPMNTTNINDEGYNNAIDRTSSLINESNTTTDVLPDGKYKYHYFKSTQYRNDPFCPDVTIIVNAVKRMVDQWKTCCSKHLSS